MDNFGYFPQPDQFRSTQLYEAYQKVVAYQKFVSNNLDYLIKPFLSLVAEEVFTQLHFRKSDHDIFKDEFEKIFKDKFRLNIENAKADQTAELDMPQKIVQTILSLESEIVSKLFTRTSLDRMNSSDIDSEIEKLRSKIIYDAGEMKFSEAKETVPQSINPPDTVKIINPPPNDIISLPNIKPVNRLNINMAGMNPLRIEKIYSEYQKTESEKLTKDLILVVAKEVFTQLHFKDSALIDFQNEFKRIFENKFRENIAKANSDQPYQTSLWGVIHIISSLEQEIISKLFSKAPEGQEFSGIDSEIEKLRKIISISDGEIKLNLKKKEEIANSNKRPYDETFPVSSTVSNEEAKQIRLAPPLELMSNKMSESESLSIINSDLSKSKDEDEDFDNIFKFLSPEPEPPEEEAGDFDKIFDWIPIPEDEETSANEKEEIANSNKRHYDETFPVSSMTVSNEEAKQIQLAPPQELMSNKKSESESLPIINSDLSKLQEDKDEDSDNIVDLIPLPENEETPANESGKKIEKSITDIQRTKRNEFLSDFVLDYDSIENLDDFLSEDGKIDDLKLINQMNKIMEIFKAHSFVRKEFNEEKLIREIKDRFRNFLSRNIDKRKYCLIKLMELLWVFQLKLRIIGDEIGFGTDELDSIRILKRKIKDKNKFITEKEKIAILHNSGNKLSAQVLEDLFKKLNSFCKTIPQNKKKDSLIANVHIQRRYLEDIYQIFGDNINDTEKFNFLLGHLISGGVNFERHFIEHFGNPDLLKTYQAVQSKTIRDLSIRAPKLSES